MPKFGHNVQVSFALRKAQKASKNPCTDCPPLPPSPDVGSREGVCEAPLEKSQGVAGKRSSR